MRARSAGRSPLAPERASDPEAAREKALALLERTRRTRSDLSRRLRAQGFTPAVVSAVVERLAAVGLLDDVEYARAFLAGRWGRRAAGWRKLEQQLRQMGISSQDVAAARKRLEQDVGAVDEVSAARRVVAQAARRYDGLDERDRRRRLYALLVRRGFDSDVIEESLREPEGAG